MKHPAEQGLGSVWSGNPKSVVGNFWFGSWPTWFDLVGTGHTHRCFWMRKIHQHRHILDTSSPGRLLAAHGRAQAEPGAHTKEDDPTPRNPPIWTILDLGYLWTNRQTLLLFCQGLDLLARCACDEALLNVDFGRCIRLVKVVD